LASLFEPIQLGAILCPNRIVMAPMTRGRATREHLPTELMADYYSQRASAGLIITEATGISQQGLGWPFAPGIWSQEQMEAWKPVVTAVHEAGGRIFCQLWHMGRVVHPSFLGGEAPVSASATTAPHKAHTYDGRQPYAEARALTIGEIDGILSDYGRAAAYAIAAGFDGVQLHAANGYLIDQFLRDGTNLRRDEYGGPVENRIRFLLEATRAIADMIGAERTAVRLSPNSETQGCRDSDPETLFTAAATALAEIGIAFLELREPGPDGTFGKGEAPVSPAIRKAFTGPLVLNSDFDLDRAEGVLAAEAADAITPTFPRGCSTRPRSRGTTCRPGTAGVPRAIRTIRRWRRKRRERGPGGSAPGRTCGSWRWALDQPQGADADPQAGDQEQEGEADPDRLERYGAAEAAGQCDCRRDREQHAGGSARSDHREGAELRRDGRRDELGPVAPLCEKKGEGASGERAEARAGILPLRPDQAHHARIEEADRE
jgi:N-ethylmaleimide reductase